MVNKIRETGIFMDLFEQENYLTEALTTSTVMNTTELRQLYYGRLNVYAQFTDDGELKSLPNEQSPFGIICYEVNDIVANKVKTSKLYANVFRIKSRNAIKDIKQYSHDMLEKDLLNLASLKYIDVNDLFVITERVNKQSLLKSPFDKLWNITKLLSGTKGKYQSKYWRRIFLDLGYDMISDPYGTGTLIKDKYPTTLVLNDNNIEQFDIVPIKSRKEQRQRISNKIDRTVRKLSTARNRVAKRKFTTR